MGPGFPNNTIVQNAYQRFAGDMNFKVVEPPAIHSSGLVMGMLREADPAKYASLYSEANFESDQQTQYGGTGCMYSPLVMRADACAAGTSHCGTGPGGPPCPPSFFGSWASDRTLWSWDRPSLLLSALGNSAATAHLSLPRNSCLHWRRGVPFCSLGTTCTRRRHCTRRKSLVGSRNRSGQSITATITGQHQQRPTLKGTLKWWIDMIWWCNLPCVIYPVCFLRHGEVKNLLHTGVGCFQYFTLFVFWGICFRILCSLRRWWNRIPSVRGKLWWNRDPSKRSHLWSIPQASPNPYPMVKVHGTVPKGGLVHGLYDPIHGDCAIYFYPGVNEKDFFIKYRLRVWSMFRGYDRNFLRQN